jgi:hypothetical protein
MSDKCFEPGTIQAFLDGETTPELSFEITTHAAACDKCALLLAQAEEENAQVFAMLAREMNSLVPTQRLWSSITVAIAEEKRQHSLWDKIRSGIMAAFANSSITVAASVLLVFSIFATIWSLRAPVGNETAGRVNSTAAGLPTQPVADFQTTGTDVRPLPAAGDPSDGIRSPGRIRGRVQTANYRPRNGSVHAQQAVLRGSEPSVEESLPGEESYIRTIADLKENVDSRKDLIMSPSTRVSFERDLAVVNDSIKKMKEVVSRNPKNQAAKQVLYSSYQNKIDLLNSVVEREELMASMQ